MDSAPYTVYHFDDEPEQLGWIPDALVSYLDAVGVEIIQDLQRTQKDHDTTLYAFTAKLNGQPQLFRYFTVGLAGWEHPTPTPEDIVIVDLRAQHPEQGVITPGPDLLRQFIDEFGPEKVLVLTAYQRDLDGVEPEIKRRLIPDNVFIKPCDQALMCRTLSILFGLPITYL